MSWFLPPDAAPPHGLVAITERLSESKLLEAYANGLFPWSTAPVRWHSPNPRAVFIPAQTRAPKNLARLSRKAQFSVSFDRAFERVMRACQSQHREEGEWISDHFVENYVRLHRRGRAHSVEVWQGEALVGGLYGVQVGAVFCGESMFFLQSNASKVALFALLEQFPNWGLKLFDTQVMTAHTHKMGAVLVQRRQYLSWLAQLGGQPAVGMGECWPSIPSKGAPWPVAQT